MSHIASLTKKKKIRIIYSYPSKVYYYEPSVRRFVSKLFAPRRRNNRNHRPNPLSYSTVLSALTIQRDFPFFHSICVKS
jgi:hypothetical protein